MASNIMLNFPRGTSKLIINHVQRRLVVNVPPTATGKRRFRLEVETDPHKLVNYCCGINYHIDEPLVKLKPDNEYPDWLWKLRLGPKPKSWELEKGSKEYYLCLAEEGTERNKLLRETSEKKKKIVGKTLLEQQEYLQRIRFAALAFMEDDAGLDSRLTEHQWIHKIRNINRKIHVRDYYLPVNENKILYKDKIPGNFHLKNYKDYPESSFIEPLRCIERRPKRVTDPILDSKRRHRYSIQ